MPVGSTPGKPDESDRPDGPPHDAAEPRRASRGALKLDHAITHFGLDVRGLRCADFGCSTGGFTDSLLRHGAASVVAIDTGYGVLDWKLRNDPRVRVMERTNALHAELGDHAPFDLISVDMSWTPQRLCVPAALKWLGPTGRLLTLIKPHYEATTDQKKAHLRKGVLEDAAAETIATEVAARMPEWGGRCLGIVRSPIRGGGGGGSGSKSAGGGNLEWLALVVREGPSDHRTAVNGP